ncbi:MAG TPA: hypothetical protein VK978_00340 [Candidatus Saccharimonadales bacterium]|nr:hypothetical protein [Candidatus Saccharimonadales bacterium]
MSVGDTASFTGVLVKTQHLPGRKYVQLAFHTAEGIKLSVSRNAAMVHSLTIGEKYLVKGTVRKLGEKLYIHEPATSLIVAQAGLLRRPSTLIILGAILLLTCGGGAAFALSQDTTTINAASPKGASTPKETAKKTPVASEKAATAITESSAAPVPASNNPTTIRSTTSTSRRTQPAAAPSTTPTATPIAPVPTSNVVTEPVVEDLKPSVETPGPTTIQDPPVAEKPSVDKPLPSNGDAAEPAPAGSSIP